MNENKDILDKVNEVDKLSELEKNRLLRKKMLSEDLVEFVRLQMSKVDKEESLKNLALKKVRERIEKDDDEELSEAFYLKLIEIMSKNDNEISIGIFNIIKEYLKDKNEDDYNNKDKDKNKDNDISREEMQEFKQFFNLMKKIKNQEFPE